MSSIRIFLATAFCALCFSAATVAQENRASLALGDRTGSANTSISVPLQIHSNGDLVGLQFDVLYNSFDIEINGVTAAALTSDHIFVTDSVDSGRQRVLVYSATNAPLANGILGDLELDLTNSFSDDQASLSLSNVSFVTADGTTLSVDVAPFVQITSPVGTTNANEFDSINLTAIAIATDGDISRVEFQANDRTIGLDSEGPFSMTWTVDAPGENLVTAVAIDSHGNIGTSSPVTVNASSPPFIDAWRKSVFTDQQRADHSISALTADPDGDHVLNYLELAFGLNPLVADRAGLPRMEILEENGQRYLALYYQKPSGISGLTYQLELFSNNTWSSDPGLITQTIQEDNGTVTKTMARAVDPISDEADLIRIRIELAP